MKNRPLVSVLVLNYNGLRFLKDCFDSLLKTQYENYEIYLVDNASTDESVTFTQENYPTIEIIQTHNNRGYSYSYNFALKQISCKYAVLLNNDVKVEKNWLSPLVMCAENDATIGALQPKILSMQDNAYFEYAGASGGFIDKFGYPFLRGRIFYTIEKDQGQYDDETEVFWTSGAAMFLRMDALKKSDYLDEEFIFHMEEIDLCWRLHLVGYRMKVIPSAKIYHFTGGTLHQGDYKKLYWNHRNNLIMIIKNLDSDTFINRFVARLILDQINIIYSLLKFDFTHAGAIAAAHIWLLFHWPQLRLKRKAVQKLKRDRTKSMERLIYPKSIIFDYFKRNKKTFSSLNFFPS